MARTGKGCLLALFLLGGFSAGCQNDTEEGLRDAESDAESDASEDAAPRDASGFDVHVDGKDSGDVSDAHVADAGGDASEECSNTLPTTAVAPPFLSDTGLYEDIAEKRVAASMMYFEPQFALWSDGAVKSRWLYLPECERKVDSTLMNLWSFPVGTYAFKEFVVDGKRIETRFVHRYGSGDDDFLYAHYLWNDEESDAELVDENTSSAVLVNPKGTDYDVPPANLCQRCHGQSGGEEGGVRSRILGFSAIQLSHDGVGETMKTLSEAGLLSRPHARGYVVPGTDTQRAALGYMHANCSHCHNDGPERVAFPVGEMDVFLKTSDTSVYDTGAYRTLINEHVLGFDGSCEFRVTNDDVALREGDGALSCVYERASVRDGSKQQMPPIATKHVDAQGLEILKAWILSL